MKFWAENYGCMRIYYMRYSCAVLLSVRVENAHISSILVTVVNAEFDATTAKFTTLKDAKAFADVVSKGVIR